MRANKFGIAGMSAVAGWMVVVGDDDDVAKFCCYTHVHIFDIKLTDLVLKSSQPSELRYEHIKVQTLRK